MKKLVLLFLLFGGICSQLCYSQSQPLPIEKLIDIFNNPINYPNYIMISAHRGYWKDYPENSLPAIQAAIDLGADMVEFDITNEVKDTIMVAKLRRPDIRDTVQTLQDTVDAMILSQLEV